MGGTPIRLDPVVSPVEEERKQQEQEEKEAGPRQTLNGAGPKVISLEERRKK
jgi:hypothetical protein